MDHFSTVLQRPPHFDEDGSNGGVGAGDDRGPRGGLRDILNPVSSVSSQASPVRGPPGTPGAPQAPVPPRSSHSSSFNLRSPTQAGDFHHPSPYSASPPSTSIGGAREPSGPRSILNNPFQVSTPSLPPPLQAPPSAASPGTATTVTAAAATAHSPSPALHAPSVYYTSEIRDREPAREKSASNGFYDPTSDATPSSTSANKERERERRVSDTGSSWRNATQVSTPKVSSQLWAPLPKSIQSKSKSKIKSIIHCIHHHLPSTYPSFSFFISPFTGPSLRHLAHFFAPHPHHQSPFSQLRRQPNDGQFAAPQNFFVHAILPFWPIHHLLE